MQVLNLKHNPINYTNALYKCIPTRNQKGSIGNLGIEPRFSGIEAPVRFLPIVVIVVIRHQVAPWPWGATRWPPSPKATAIPWKNKHFPGEKWLHVWSSMHVWFPCAGLYIQALLQGMHPQLMQLLNLKHSLMNYTNALYKCSPTKFESTKMHCASAVQLNLKHDLTTRMHCVSAVQLNLKHSCTTKLHCTGARQ